MKNINNSVVTKSVGAGLLLGLAALSMASEPIQVVVDGQVVQFEGTQPQMRGDYVMIPLRGVFERLGATVDWRSFDQSISAKRGETKVDLKINDHNAWVNGQQIYVPSAPIVSDGSTLVPIRFISESLGARVDWNPSSRVVSIDTKAMYGAGSSQPERPMMVSMQPRGTVIPVKLDTALSSDTSYVGDKFTATIDTKGNADYFGLPEGTKIEGHVTFAQARDGKTPGVLGLDYDSILMRDGSRVPISASMIGLDNKSVVNRDGRLVAKASAENKDDMKYVGTGAGVGAIIALATKGNVVSNAVIGGALGYLYQHFLGGQQDVKNVELNRGTPLGVRLDQDVTVKVYR